MASPDKWLYEYAVVRLVPRIDREEFVNIGLLMMCKRQKWLKGKIFINEEKVRAIFPHADIKQVAKQSALFERTDVPQPDLAVEEKYRWLSASKSAMLQTSPSHPGMLAPGESDEQDTMVLEKEFNRLFDILVG